MAHSNPDWEDLGRNVQDIIDRAINQQDYRRLEQTIRQTIEKAVDAGGEAVRKAMDGSRLAQERPVIVEQAKTEKLPVLYGSTGGKTAGGIVKIVGGSLLTALMFAMTLAVTAFQLVMESAAMVPLGISLAGLLGGVALIGNGIRNLKRLSRFKIYRRTIGDKTSCKLETLAGSVGKNVNFVRRELQQMIRDGLFLQGHMDKEQTRLITSDETFRQFEKSRVQLEYRQWQQAQLQSQKPQKAAPSTHSPQVQEVLDKGDTFVEEIRRCNDAIPGAVMSGKIDRMERIVERIFDRAEEHPEVIPDLKKMMDYYLPMTVKLLNAYADMDAQPYQGETIENSKREIEATLDILNQAFEKLLDELFADTALDISSDISVLHTLLAQEGLKEDELSRMKKEKTL